MISLLEDLDHGEGGAFPCVIVKLQGERESASCSPVVIKVEEG